MRFIAGLAVALALLAVPVAGQVPDPATTALMQQLQPGATLADYTARLQQEFRQLDADSDGVLTAADADLHDAAAKTQLRAGAAMQFLRFDLDHDGIVTADEVRRAMRYEQRAQTRTNAEQMIEAEVKRIMAADKNGDGKVTLEEAMDAAEAQMGRGYNMMYGLSTRVRQLIALSPGHDNRLALADFEALGAARFHAVDTDNNGTISQDEFNAYRRREADEARRKAEEARRQAQAVRDEKAQAECLIPKASDTARIAVLSAHRAEALSRVALGSQDVVTRTGEIMIEEGSEPLYIVVISQEPTIWRVTGAVERVERLVAASLTTADANMRLGVAGNVIRLGDGQTPPNMAETTPLIGITGLPADRVTFVRRATCFKAFTETQSIDAAYSIGLVRRHAGKNPAMITGRYDVGAFLLPSDAVRSAYDDRTQPRVIIVKQYGTLNLAGDASGVVIRTGPVDLDKELAETAPGGVIDIDEKSVVASAAVVRYDLLPGLAGLMQLMNSGTLTRNHEGEFIIHRQIRFPAGLDEHHVTFLLLHGVPLPQGDSGGAMVIAEDTGQQIKLDRR
jgi:Ca2+-binding EF-hand superfamily protein